MSWRIRFQKLVGARPKHEGSKEEKDVDINRDIPSTTATPRSEPQEAVADPRTYCPPVGLFVTFLIVLCPHVAPLIAPIAGLGFVDPCHSIARGFAWMSALLVVKQVIVTFRRSLNDSSSSTKKVPSPEVLMAIGAFVVLILLLPSYVMPVVVNECLACSLTVALSLLVSLALDRKWSVKETVIELIPLLTVGFVYGWVWVNSAGLPHYELFLEASAVGVSSAHAFRHLIHDIFGS